ncbi:MAG TPA: hypothetical protein VFH87_06455 [Candidatus Udaeobacter sp.]|nr:hypothetical protein [Candidatus Udaeobacter sp.]
MKDRNTQLTAVLFVIAFALAPIVQAAPSPDGGPTRPPPNEAPRPDGGPTRPPPNEAPRPDGGPVRPANDRISANSEASSQDETLPVITINSIGDVTRGKTGSFVLGMNPIMFGGSYVNFSVSGTAIPGADYVPLVSPAHIGQSGYGVILVQTLPDRRGPNSRQSYSVVVTLEPGAGYALGEPKSAKMMIKP